MEKAMHAAHGVGYEVYKREHEIRIAIEKKREKDYMRSQRVASDFERKLYV